MSETHYTPPKVWTHAAGNGGQFANINRPTAGAQTERELPVGDHSLQLYSLATPNGVKASIMLEELLEAGHDAEYDAWPIDIRNGDQFTSGFVGINPNSKIPALVDRSQGDPVRVFESGAILLYLAEKYGAFLPTGPDRTETLNWLFWQIGSAPFIGGGFGHFYAYAPEKLEYPINRYAMETKRLFDVANQRLGESAYLGGDQYSIADMAAFPWLAPFTTGEIYEDARTFLSIDQYAHVGRWAQTIAERPAVRRGRIVTKPWGEENTQLHERHSVADFAGKSV